MNDLLEGEKIIRDIRFLYKELLPGIEGDRGTIYDIFCISDTGEYFIVEMQNIHQANFNNRALYYLSRAIERQAERGRQWRFDLKAVYGVFFMNFRLRGTPDKLRTDVILADRETHEQFSDKLRFIFIGLPSFTKEERECETDFDKWIYVLKNMQTLKKIPFKNQKAIFEKLEQIAETASMTRKEWEVYENTLDIYRDNLAVSDYIEQSEQRGEARGEARGEERGMEKGERNKQLAIARNMKTDGLATDTIAKYTGLSVEEIKKL